MANTTKNVGGEIRIKDSHFNQFARDLVSNLKEKQQKVLMKRFGLSGRKKITLDAIGKEFGVTRERIRQIEVASLNKLRKLVILEHNKPVFDKIKTIIENNGGVIQEDKLVNELILDLEQNRTEEIKKILKFLLLLSNEIQTIEETEHTKSGWALATYKKEVIEDIVKAFGEILDSRKETMNDEIIMAEVLKHAVAQKHAKYVNPEFLKSTIDISKKLHATEDGKRGLTSWPWVKPKTIRDKIFYVLSKKNEPMHFTEIFNSIKNASFDQKNATVQTIHNELISDKRFILVGRGLYGLSDWGFEPGTVEEVIEKILTKGQPMSQEDIVEEVMKKKKVKKATVLINLQNSPKFSKTAEGYIVKK
ncbi:MAG TPA: sigma factor-like helix-turn-helix DNA-binding protein [Patescibacteria group bacterium]|nr:sigma factor-like helix-turn-helix DNA-binding protein [Patescibacteria group bacterium]